MFKAVIGEKWGVYKCSKHDGMEASIREIKDMLSKSHEKTSSFGSKDANENVAFSGGGPSSSLPRPTKLDFPCYSGDDPIVWLDRLAQYFDYKRIPADKQVPLATFHLEGEANQWWQWMKKVHREENVVITWEIFEKELLVRFGPTEIEDYDEALSRIH